MHMTAPHLAAPSPLQGGVYDVTEWLDGHPGGAAKLMLAAGGAIDPYWAMYQQHNVPEVHKILETYRIGNLKGYTAGAVQVWLPCCGDVSGDVCVCRYTALDFGE